MPQVPRVLPVAWLTGLLCLPAAAWVGGVRQPNLEQRPKAEFPAINRSSLPNPKTFTRLDAAFLDRLPLRTYALEARGEAALALFHDQPNPNVFVGKGRWLFYGEELRACRPGDGIPGPSPVDGAELLARTMVASGRNTTVVVVGSKIVALRDRLNDPMTDVVDCVADLEQRIHDRLADAPGGLDLEPAFDAVRRGGNPLFMKYDTHWNGTGRLIFDQLVLDRIRPGLAAQVGLTLGPKTRWPGDLGVLSGIPLTEPLRTPIAVRAAAPAFARGEVLLLGDSQLEHALLNRRPGRGGPSVRDVALPGAATCTWPEYADGTCDDAIKRSKTIVIERVARNAREIGTGCWRGVSLAAEPLRGRRSQWQRVDGVPSPGVDLQVDGTATVRVAPAGGDTRNVPRLMRLPVKQLPPSGDPKAPSAVSITQRPGAMGEVPCVTPSQTEAGKALFFPLRAGERAADTQFVIQAPKGTVLGPPEEIVLDGKRVRQR